MFEVFLSGFVGCGSLYGLICDWNNRKKFAAEFLSNTQIGNKRIFEGKITSDNYSTQLDTVNVPFLEWCQYHPLLKIDLHNKKDTIYHYYNHGRCPDIMSCNFYLGHHCVRISEQWDTENILSFQTPDIKLNGIEMILDCTSKILYTNFKDHYISHSKTINEQYIPNNSTVTVFGSMQNTMQSLDDNNNNTQMLLPQEKKLRAKYIGSRQNVLNEIAYDYYGISDGLTAMLTSAFIISVIGTLFLLKR